MIFAISYMMGQYSPNGTMIIQYNSYAINPDAIFLKALGIFDKIVFGNTGFASALSQSDLTSGAYTCPIDKNGSICQQYTASDCAANCAVDCLPTTADQTSQCKIGTCYDPVQGTCQIGAPQVACQQDGGQWFNDPNGNVAQCKPGCCLLGSNAYFETSQQCSHDSNVTGLTEDFRPEVSTELACLALSQTQVQGACVIASNTQNSCKFTTQVNCEQDLGGKFYPNLLCSNNALNTGCKSQATIGCVQGKDEVYWFDSCGNQENIYDANKVKSYNNGMILSKNSACSLASGNNLLANQATCGNCNFVLGSICGASTNTQKLSEPNANVVCKDLSCVDADGQKRVNGESWCAYQGSTGTAAGAGGFLRSTDTVGSRDFRETCINGQIETDQCADYRNEICVESQTSTPNTPTGKISSAACRINLGYECYDYNKNNDMNSCKQNPDCFVKSVQVSGSFNFNICAPKYVPGFDLTQRGTGAAAICSIANQQCQVVYVKELFGGWQCKANCECQTSSFAEQMNDLCISLGDCGTKVNYIGDLTKNEHVFKSTSKDSLGNEVGASSGDLSNNYVNGLVKYADENLFKNQYIQASDISSLYGNIGIPGWLGQAQSPTDPTAGVTGELSMISGMVGILVLAAAHTSIGLASLGALSSAVAQPTEIGQVTGTGAYGLTPAASAAFGAIGGATLGLALVSFLIDFTGIGKGLPPAVTYSLMAVGATAGGIIGANIAAGGGLGSFSAAWTSLAFLSALSVVLIAIVIIAIIVLSLLGIGDTKTVYYSFECDPWQAPNGGAKCDQCGKDGFPCSQYSCQSLGQNCQLINEGSANPACVNINPNDTSSPVITPATNLLPDGYTAQQTQNGVKITTSNGGCLTENYQQIPFGINLNKYGQCKIDTEHTASFDDMQQPLDSGLYLENHSLPLVIPSLESLGVQSFNPNATADYNIYLRCQDKSGNTNTNEYDINFCIAPGNDTTPAAITYSDPSTKTLAFNTTSINASVYTSEPANCNWDTKDTDYNLMANNFSCATDFAQRTLYGWKCNALLPFSGNSTTYYVRCLDQPWLTGDNATKRNANTQSYPLTFTRSSKALNIDSINVDGKNLSFGVAPASVEVDVKTSGGLDGTAECAYVWGNSTIDFFSTLSTSHSQVFQTLYPGEITLPIICTDSVGNVAQKTAHFNILLDTTPPIITRIYSQSGQLNIITDEQSTCYYSNDDSQKCLFDISNASIFNGIYTNDHSINFDTSQVYYVKCKDKIGNYPGTCSTIVREGNYDSQQL